MKLWKNTLITAFAFLGISTTVLYTACEKDSCVDLQCKNGGSCAEGFCRCPTGYEGTECEILAADKFIGKFIGNTRCDNNPPLYDTVRIFMLDSPNVVNIVRSSAIGDTLKGTAMGYELMVDENTTTGVTRDVNIVVENKKLTFYISEQSGEDKVVCTFIGAKQ